MEVGKQNSLPVLRAARPGLYLDGGDGIEILLPRRYVPAGLEPGQVVDVFVYRDSEDRLIATTEKPKVLVGQCAYLKVVAVNQVGAFLDWGLPKDLLVPYAQQAERMEAGKSYVVTAYLDANSNRVVASSRLGRWLREEGNRFRQGQPVDLLIASRTDLGWKAVVNHTHVGLIFFADATRELRPGQRLQGFVKRIRPGDQRIDLALSADRARPRHDLEQEILAHLEACGGRSDMTDSATPARILEQFGVSKGSFKKALGALYRARRIVIEEDAVTLVPGGIAKPAENDIRQRKARPGSIKPVGKNRRKQAPVNKRGKSGETVPAGEKAHDTVPAGKKRGVRHRGKRMVEDTRRDSKVPRARKKRPSQAKGDTGR